MSVNSAKAGEEAARGQGGPAGQAAVGLQPQGQPASVVDAVHSRQVAAVAVRCHGQRPCCGKDGTDPFGAGRFGGAVVGPHHFHLYLGEPNLLT
jgi:hypothetical protein